jgi:hypothetical protein
MLRTPLTILLAAVTLVGCFDETKTGCQDDGECSGVRVCRQNVCVTPEGFSDDDLGVDPTPDPQPDGVRDVLGGDACEPPGARFGALLLTEDIELQALALGQAGRIEAIGQGLDGRQSFDIIMVSGGRVFVEYGAPSILPEARVDLGLDDAVVVRYVFGGLMGAHQLLEIRTENVDNPLALAWCVSDGLAPPCAGEDWSFERTQGQDVCPPTESACGLGERFPLRMVLGGGSPEILYPGQGALLPVGDREVLHWAAEGIAEQELCPGAEAHQLEGLLMRLTP